MHLAVLVLGLAIFARISFVAGKHFKSDAMPKGMLATLFITLAGLVSFGWFVGTEPPSILYLVIASVFFVGAIALFEWAILTTSRQNFAVAYDPKLPDRFVTVGPYRYVRHPFYSSYLLFWIGCAVATTHWTSLLVLVALLVSYTLAAVREEQGFAASQFAGEYAEYRTRAGRFLPKWPR